MHNRLSKWYRLKSGGLALVSTTTLDHFKNILHLEFHHMLCVIKTILMQKSFLPWHSAIGLDTCHKAVWKVKN